MRAAARRWLSEYWASLLAAGALALAGLYPVYDGDVYGQMAAAREIAELGHVPDVDRFSLLHDPPPPWRNPNWLSGLCFYSLYATGGAGALIALKLLLLAVTGAALVQTARQTGGSSAGVACVVLQVAAIPALRLGLSVRPQLFGYLLGALLLLALTRMASAPAALPRARLLAALAFAQALWVNLDGSSVVGLAMTAIFVFAHARVATLRREFGVLLGLQLLASCATPFGPALLFDTLVRAAQPGVGSASSGFAALSVVDRRWYLAALAAQALLVVAVARPLRRAGPAGASLLFVASCVLLLGPHSSRSVALALFLSAPAIAVGVAPWLSAPGPRARTALAATGVASAVMLAGVGAAALPPPLSPGVGESSIAVPVASGRWLARHNPRARIADAGQDTWYLRFVVPEARGLFGGGLAVRDIDTVARMQAAFANAQSFRALLDRHAVDSVLLRYDFAGHAAALEAMRAAPDFALVMLEDRHALFVQRGVGAQGLGLSHLPPGYEPKLPDADLEPELARLRRFPSAAGYVAYYAALERLRPMLRARGLDGIRSPRDDAERARLRDALVLLRRAGARLPDVPVALTFHALVAAHACQLDEARAVILAAGDRGDKRRRLLVEQEIALRSGDRTAVEAFLRRVASLRRMQADPWIDAIERELGERSASCR